MAEKFNSYIYSSFFHHNICHVCKSPENLKRCSLCKSIAYCSKEHQKLDWKIHKEFCTAMNKVNRECEFIAITNFNDFLTVKKIKYRLLYQYLKRELLNFENQMWMFPRYCEICFSYNVTVECEKCRSVFYCSENHKLKFKDLHDKYCEALILNIQIGLHPIFNDIKEINMVARDIPKLIRTLPSNLQEFLNLYDKMTSLKTDDLMQGIRKLNCLSPTATILYGLERIGFINYRKAQKSELTIHIVGASIYEFGRLWKHMSELAFHWVENLTQLDFIIIGPELDHTETIDKFTRQLCDSCKKKNCRTTCSFHTALYHDVIKDLNEPDVVVAFNSGIHGTEIENFLSHNENSSENLWKDSIALLLDKPNIPLILTAYIFEELQKDISEIIKHAKSDVNILVEPHRNPFSDAKPLRNFESQIEPVFYINGYMSVLTRV